MPLKPKKETPLEEAGRLVNEAMEQLVGAIADALDLEREEEEETPPRRPVKAAAKKVAATKKAAPTRIARRKPEPEEEEEEQEDEEEEEEEERDWAGEKWTSGKLAKLDRSDLKLCADAFGVEYGSRTHTDTMIDQILEAQKEAAKPKKAVAKKAAAPVRRGRPRKVEEEEEEEEETEEEEEEETEEDEGEFWTAEELEEKSLGELKAIARDLQIRVKPGMNKEALLDAILGDEE